MTQEINKETNNELKVYYEKSSIMEEILLHMVGGIYHWLTEMNGFDELFEEASIPEEQEKLTQDQVDLVMEKLQESVEAEQEYLQECFDCIDISETFYLK